MGLKDGYWIEYSDIGKPASEGMYKNEKQEGLWKFYNQYGGLEREQYFKNGFPDGKFVEYHPNHQIATMGYYKNTAKVGEWILYDQNGKIIAKMFFDSNGNLLKKAIPTP
jgi:antitoxin component YwqK of YwqJK toxin-antitoxin module